jgi:hypothetical protein
MALDDDVTTALTASRAAHLAYRSALSHARPAEARVALVTAQETRLAALALDPDRTSPVWATFEKTHPHAQLLSFYEAQLARPA